MQIARTALCDCEALGVMAVETKEDEKASEKYLEIVPKLNLQWLCCGKNKEESQGIRGFSLDLVTVQSFLPKLKRAGML